MSWQNSSHFALTKGSVMTRAGPNETGSLLHEPIPKLLSGQQYHLRRAAQLCPRVATVTEKMPSGFVHFARVKCRSCGAFIKWLPRPQTIAHRQLNSFKLAKLAMCDRLNRWEQSFVENVSQRKTLSPRQQEIVDRLIAQYLQVTP
jgi:hypothetical protein